MTTITDEYLDELEKLAKDVRYSQPLNEYVQASERFNRTARTAVPALIAEVRRLRGALSCSVGYMMNARIDLETGCPKKTAVQTIQGGIDKARAALKGQDDG